MGDTFHQLHRTRRKLLRSLSRSASGASVEQLGAAAGVTHNAVRQHLTAMIASGWVERQRTRATGGRPEQVFALTEDGRELLPRRYADLASDLVGAMADEVGGERLRLLLQRIGTRAGTEAAGALPAGAGPAARTEALAALMSELGYEASARVSDPRVAPQIVAHNCVFHRLAARHPEVCSFDLAFLEQASGTRVEHAECIVRGGSCCRFRFGARRR